MSTFITKTSGSGSGPTVAVKDLIDVAGVPTTAGCRAVARRAQPAAQDARCLAGLRSAGARIVGKTNLHELAMLPFGTNPWFGTPVNPLDPEVIPGGSSSGSAVAVATEDAEVALGSDTGGSVRIPAACCGIAGLKTTHGRISLEGVWPLAPTLDTVGPMARDVSGLILGMGLLEPGFTPGSPAHRIGRVRTSGDPRIEAAVDEALQRAGLDVVAVDLDLDTATACFTTIYCAELWEADRELIAAHPEEVGDDVRELLALAEVLRAGVPQARETLARWCEGLDRLFREVELLALPTLGILPPRLADLVGDLTSSVVELTRYTAPFNASGTPCTAQPLPLPGSPIPASLQLVGPRDGEELLLPTAARIELAVR